MLLEIMETLSSEFYLRPQSLAEAVAALSGSPVMIVAGCTDFYPVHVGKPLPPQLVDVSAIAEMRQIAIVGDHVRIGGAVTWHEIASASLPPAFRALQEAARQVGSIQVQNRGTIAGNICTASPAADGVPPLLVLNADVEIASSGGIRKMPLAAFVTGYRMTALARGEVLSAIVIPRPVVGATSAFQKLGARKYLVISIVMTAAFMRKDKVGRIVEARIAVGSAAAKAQRLHLLENEIVGCLPTDVEGMLRNEHFDALHPIDDVRASARYRLDAARHLVVEALKQAAGD